MTPMTPSTLENRGSNPRGDASEIRQTSTSIVVNCRAVPDCNHKDSQNGILKTADDSVIPHPVPPKAMLRLPQRFTVGSWVHIALNSFLEKFKNLTGGRRADVA